MKLRDSSKPASFLSLCSFLALLLAGSFVYGQTHPDPVTIGTPSSLDIAALTLKNNTSSWKLLALDGNTDDWFLGSFGSGGFFISQNSFASANAKFVIKGDYVGLGTATPTAELEVGSSGSNHSRLHLNAATAGNHAIIRFQDAGNSSWGFLSRYPSGGKFTLYNYLLNTPAMVVDENNKVGIGTTSPSSLLTLGDGTTTNQESSGITLGTTHRTIEYVHSNYAAGYGSKLYGVDEGGGITSWRVAVRGNSSAWLDALYIKASSTSGNGNVGISTTSPDEKLTVNGNIHTKEVRVDLSVPGPDYVFDPDYDLPTLEDINAYIIAHKHLPEIPSAKEMEDNGVELGVMNMLLLKKIEELTLYLIRQQKEINDLKLSVNKNE